MKYTLPPVLIPFYRYQNKASTLSGAGNYHIVNVATGESLSFVREGSPARTNVRPQANYNPTAIEVRLFLLLYPGSM